MLKNIQLHIDQDESRQLELEANLAETMRLNSIRNRAAFESHVPALLHEVSHITLPNVALMSNKDGQPNIVDFGAGRTLYGLEPLKEIQLQYEAAISHCIYVDFELNDIVDKQNDSTLDVSGNYSRLMQMPGLPKKIEVLVMLGIGLGHHLEMLLANHQIDHLIIYEPELQYFQCSTLALRWDNLFRLADCKRTSLYLQIQKDSRNLLEDIQELHQVAEHSGFFLYKHYNHPVFDQIADMALRISWNDWLKKEFHWKIFQEKQYYLPLWTPTAAIDTYSSVKNRNQQKFERNLVAFKKYFKKIYDEFVSYKPKKWVAVETNSGEINLLDKMNLVCWYGKHPKEECDIHYQHFKTNPHRDDLILGYEGVKLQAYTHYRFVKKTGRLLDENENAVAQLPERVKSIIMFGTGLGYQVDSLFSNHQLEKVFICEPNKDFFFASLYVADWASHLEKIDSTDGRIYLNIGDDGSHLFRDLLNQFYAVGPYMLANTYFYQCYFNANLVKAISQLREQLQVVISMGEYYDHARYGIAQTNEAIKRGYRFLFKDASSFLQYYSKETPIMLVGNGPSLDQSIAAIKKWKSKALIISCGTSLQVLYKNGITPDFHAEIEQNRSTFDWCFRIEDNDYLSNITLISCNGIHPDTCGMFKQVLIAFKEGESSSTVAQNVLSNDVFESLKFAFPTVSNFAINVFTKMGFNQIYLLGIDLGFVNNKEHHSSQSGYYSSKGYEVYDYALTQNTAHTVPGNFRKQVYTKYEFKVSKTIIEQTLATRRLDCFNCSDGAKIEGATPLLLENLLLSGGRDDKQVVIDEVINNCFGICCNPGDFEAKFSSKYSKNLLYNEFNAMLTLVKQELLSIEQAESLIEKQKVMLFTSYKNGQSLLFYYLYGSTNYANALLSKLLNKTKTSLVRLNQAREFWFETLQIIKSDLENSPDAFDFSCALPGLREVAYAKEYRHKRFVSCIYSKNVNPRFLGYLLLARPAHDREQMSFGGLDEGIQSDAIAYIVRSGIMSYLQPLKSFVIKQNDIHYSPTVIIGWIGEHKVELVRSYFNGLKHNLCCVVFLDRIEGESDYKEFLSGNKPHLLDAQGAGFLKRAYIDADKFSIVIPKLQFVETRSHDLSHYIHRLRHRIGNVPEFIEFHNYLAIPRKGVDLSECILDSLGNRGRYVSGDINLDSLLGRPLTLTQAQNIVNGWLDEPILKLDTKLN